MENNKAIRLRGTGKIKIMEWISSIVVPVGLFLLAAGGACTAWLFRLEGKVSINKRTNLQLEKEIESIKSNDKEKSLKLEKEIATIRRDTAKHAGDPHIHFNEDVARHAGRLQDVKIDHMAKEVSELKEIVINALKN